MFLVSLSTMSTAQPRRFRVGVVSWGGATSMTAEAQSWEALCAQLRRGCARLTRNSHDAEDLAAGIVLELLLRAGAAGELVRECGRGLAPLLLHRARGRWGNFRRDQRTRRAEPDVALDDIPDRGISGDPLTKAERSELARSLPRGCAVGTAAACSEHPPPSVVTVAELRGHRAQAVDHGAHCSTRARQDVGVPAHVPARARSRGRVNSAAAPPRTPHSMRFLENVGRSGGPRVDTQWLSRCIC